MSKYLPDDIDDHIDLRFLPGKSKVNISPLESFPFFSYQYLNIGTVPSYCFNHGEFIQDEYYSYFQKVREFSKQKIGEITRHNFRISRPNSRLLDLFKSSTGISRRLSEDEIPEFGHFHLTDTPMEEGSKRPVIHFFIGYHGVLYILSYDPYHKIHPTTH